MRSLVASTVITVGGLVALANAAEWLTPKLESRSDPVLPLALSGQSDQANLALDPLGPSTRESVSLGSPASLSSAELDHLARTAAAKVHSRSCHGRTAGTGVLVTVDGLTALITNQHVVGSSTVVNVEIGAAGDTAFEAEVVAVNAARDIAIALPTDNVRPPVVPAVDLDGQSSSPGDPLLVVGFAGGHDLAIVEGTTQTTVSGKAYGFAGDVILINGAAVPGMSGGPLFTSQGRLAGVVAAVDRTTGLVVGVPAAEIAEMIEYAGVEPDRVDPAAGKSSSACP